MNKTYEKKQFIKYLQHADISKNTYNSYLQFYNASVKLIDNFDEDTVNTFIQDKINLNLSAAYINKLIQTLNLYSKVNNYDMCFDKVKQKRVNYKTLTSSQINQIIAVAPPPDTYGVFFAICAYTGMRPCEVASLTVDNIDLSSNTINITLPDTKTKKHQRIIPIMPILVPILVDYLTHNSNDPQLFYTDKDKWGKVWRKRCKKVGLDVPLYSLRRSFATNCLADGIHLEELKELMGHSDIGSTMVYYQHNMEILQRAIKKSSYNDSINDAKVVIEKTSKELDNIYVNLINNPNIRVNYQKSEHGLTFTLEDQNGTNDSK